MKCPKCDGETRVLASRYRKNREGTTRSRVCLQCSYRFPTIEIILPHGRRPTAQDLLKNLPEPRRTGKTRKNQPDKA